MKFKKIKKEHYVSCMLCGKNSEWFLIDENNEVVDIGANKCDEYYCMFSLCSECFNKLKKVFKEVG